MVYQICDLPPSAVLAMAVPIYLKIPVQERIQPTVKRDFASEIFEVSAVDPCSGAKWQASAAFKLDRSSQKIVLQFWDEQEVGVSEDDVEIYGTAIEIAAFLEICNRPNVKVDVQALAW